MRGHIQRRSLAVAWLVIAAACSRAGDPRRAPFAEELVAQNNRGVGLMGQFDFAAAHLENSPIDQRGEERSHAMIAKVFGSDGVPRLGSRAASRGAAIPS